MFSCANAACHILTEGLAPSYELRNFGAPGNCTLTALYPAVVEIKALSVGDGAMTMAELIDFSVSNVKRLMFNLMFN